MDAKIEFNECPYNVGHGSALAGVLTSRWAARLALKALCTSLARFGGRLSFLLRPRLEDMVGVADEINEVDVEVVVRMSGGGTWKSEGVEGRRWLIAADRYRHTAEVHRQSVNLCPRGLAGVDRETTWACSPAQNLVQPFGQA